MNAVVTCIKTPQTTREKYQNKSLQEIQHNRIHTANKILDQYLKKKLIYYAWGHIILF